MCAYYYDRKASMNQSFAAAEAHHSSRQTPSFVHSLHRGKVPAAIVAVLLPAGNDKVPQQIPIPGEATVDLDALYGYLIREQHFVMEGEGYPEIQLGHYWRSLPARYKTSPQTCMIYRFSRGLRLPKNELCAVWRADPWKPTFGNVIILRMQEGAIDFRCVSYTLAVYHLQVEVNDLPESTGKDGPQTRIDDLTCSLAHLKKTLKKERLERENERRQNALNLLAYELRIKQLSRFLELNFQGYLPWQRSQAYHPPPPFFPSASGQVPPDPAVPRFPRRRFSTPTFSPLSQFSPHPGMAFPRQGMPYSPHPGMGMAFSPHPGMAPNPPHPGMAPNPPHPGMAPNPPHPGMAPNHSHPGMAPIAEIPSEVPSIPSSLEVRPTASSLELPIPRSDVWLGPSPLSGSTSPEEEDLLSFPIRNRAFSAPALPSSDFEVEVERSEPRGFERSGSGPIQQLFFDKDPVEAPMKELPDAPLS